MKGFAMILAIVLASIGADVATLSPPGAVPMSVPSGDGYCCKVCRRGCACGDSCIDCSKTCRVGPGCACDGYADLQE